MANGQISLFFFGYKKGRGFCPGEVSVDVITMLFGPFCGGAAAEPFCGLAFISRFSYSAPPFFLQISTAGTQNPAGNSPKVRDSNFVPG